MGSADLTPILVSGLAINGAGYGQSLVHTSLSNALADEGTYGRRFASAGGSTAYGKLVANGAPYVSIPNTKSISVRAWCRAPPHAGTLYGAVAIAARTKNPGEKTNISVSGHQVQMCDGYNAGLHYIGSATQLRISLTAWKAGTAVAASNVLYLVEEAGINQWYKLRLDVTPLLDSNDDVKFYTGTGPTGSEVWTLRHSVILPSSDNRHVPAAANDHCGLYAVANSNANSNHVCYADRLQIFTEDV